MRRREIDWIRNICILMLFVYHTSAIFTDFGDFYIKTEKGNLFSNGFILLTFTWYMPVLFFLAGASTYFALQRRSGLQYIMERIKKLLIPFIFGIIVIVPPQTYLARLWRGESNINYFSHMKKFFTNISDFMGFDGNFSPAHLWFILFLFIISIIGVSVIKGCKVIGGKKILLSLKGILLSKTGIVLVIGLTIISEMIPGIGGKGLFLNLLMFLFGYIAYGDIDYINAISKYRRTFAFINGVIIILGLGYFISLRNMELGYLQILIETMLKSALIIVSIITIVGYGIKYLNAENKVLIYLNKASFPVYIMHQTILLTLAFFILPLMLPAWITIITLIVLSFVITFALYEIIKRTKYIGILIGMK